MVLENGRETILVVDNDPVVLGFVAAVLKRASFRVLLADGAEAALDIARMTSARTDLLLSDVELPTASGPDLGETLKKSRPDLRVMLMSGGSTGNLLVLNYGWAYIQKPLISIKLIEMINAVLHSADRSQLGGQEFESQKLG